MLNIICIYYSNKTKICCTIIWFDISWRKGYLEVVLWVPVRVEDDAGVSSRQVDAQAARPRAQQEDKAVRVRLAEAVDGRLTQVPADAPVDTLVRVAEDRYTHKQTQTHTHAHMHKVLLKSGLERPTTTFL